MQGICRFKTLMNCRTLLGAASIIAIGFSQVSYAQTNENKAGTEMFTGCADRAVLSRPDNAPMEKILNAAGHTDPESKRVFKSFSLEQASEVKADEFDGICWSRLDGLWREQMRVTFDNDVKPGGWAATSPAAANLAHGMYTTPVYIVVEPTEDGEELAIQSALGIGSAVKFEATDSVSIDDVFSKKADEKKYVSNHRGGRSQRLSFDLSATGYMRLKLGERTFLRPKPKISEGVRSSQEGANNLFAIAYNPRNLIANRQGYDVTIQNPNDFLDNRGRLLVFAPSMPRDYYIAEQMTVPLGLELIEEGNKQGMVFFDTLISSESEYQQSTKSAFGFNAGLTGKKGGPEGVKQYDPASASVGYGNAKENSNSMRSKNSVATINAYQRSKKYALVRDHAYSDLSDAFVDAVSDAAKNENFQRIIDDFGTHYPYAATYGTAGRLRTYMTESTFARNSSTFRQDSGSAGFSIGPLEVKSTYESSKQLSTGNSVTNKYGETVFTAVGGNGSWDQNGFSAGDAPFPILMDLRTLDELLNPMYFPGRPEIYETARLKLSEAITAYLLGKPTLSSASLIKDIKPLEEKQTFTVRVDSLECIRAGWWEGTGNPVQIHGAINLRFPGHRNVFGHNDLYSFKSSRDTNDDYAEIPCPGGSHAMDAKQFKRFRGTRAELNKAKWQIHLNLWEWDWGLNAVDGQEQIRNKAHTGLSVPNIGKGETKIVSWDVPPNDPGMPRLRINVKFERQK